MPPNDPRHIVDPAGKRVHPLLSGRLLLIFLVAGAFAVGALLGCGDSLWSKDPSESPAPPGPDPPPPPPDTGINLTGDWDLTVEATIDTCNPANEGKLQQYFMTLVQDGTRIEGELMQAPLTGSLQGNLFRAEVVESNQPLGGGCLFDREIRLQATVSNGTENPFLYGQPPTGFDYRYRVHGGSGQCQGECEARGVLYGFPHTENGNGNGNGEDFLGGLNQFTLAPPTITDTCYGGVFLPFVPTETFQVDVPGEDDLPTVLVLPLPPPLPVVELPLVWDPASETIRIDPVYDPITATLYFREVVPYIPFVSNCLLTADATGLLTPTSATEVHVLVEVSNLRFSTLCPPNVASCLPCGLPDHPNPNCTISVSLPGTYVGE